MYHVPTFCFMYKTEIMIIYSNHVIVLWFIDEKNIL